VGLAPGRDSARTAPTVGAGRMVRRALRRQCPLCGASRIFLSWFQLQKTCSHCGLKLARNEEPDYWMGGYLLNFIVAELIVSAFIVAGIIIAWPDVPWRTVLYVTAAAAIIGPLLTFPFAKTVWLAIDLTFRPPEAVDFETPGSRTNSEGRTQH
jgi:uncharacterized protein (DUF983 family)